MKRRVLGKIMLFCLFFAFATTFMVSPFPAKAGEKIKIGIIGPMNYVQGQHAWYGAELAADEINAEGGIKVGNSKKQVELIRIDTNEIASVVDATSAVERAITREKVDFLIGGCSSGAILAMQDVAMDHKTVFLICGSGSDPEITDRVGKDYDRYKYFFRPAPINAIHIVKLILVSTKALADQISNDLGVETPRIAFLFEQARWLDRQLPLYQEHFPKMGIEVAGVWRMSIQAKDVAPQLHAIRRSDAHIILAMTSGPVAIPLYRQVWELEIPAAITGVNVEAEGGKFWEATGGGAVYGGFTAQRSKVAMTHRTLPFYEKFEKRYEMRPTLTAGSYDSVLILKEAIERAGSTDSDEVVKGLEQTDFEGTMGRVVFNENHDCKFGPGYLTGVGAQWLPNGEIGTWWPQDWEGITYEGVQKFQFSPWMKEYWEKKTK